MEGDAGGGGFVGGEHGGGGQGCGAVFLVELVHGLHEAGAGLRVLERVEEVEGVEAVGDEVVEMDADKVGLGEVCVGVGGAGEFTSALNHRHSTACGTTAWGGRSLIAL